MMPVPPSPMCQKLTSCEGLQKQGWQVNTMEGTVAKQTMRGFSDNFLTFKHGTEFAYVSPPTLCTLVQEIPYHSCQCAGAARS